MLGTRYEPVGARW